MELFINGRYTDPESTRELTKITQQEFKAIQYSLNYLIKKYTLGLKMDKKDLLSPFKKVNNFSVNSHILKYVKEITYPKIIEIMKSDIKICRYILNSLKKPQSDIDQSKENKKLPILSLYSYEFDTLIHALLHTISDLMEVVNSGINYFNRSIKIADSMGLISSGPVTDSSNKKDRDNYNTAKTIHNILCEINIPYEGIAYFNEYGELSNISEIFIKPTTHTKTHNKAEEYSC